MSDGTHSETPAPAEETAPANIVTGGRVLVTGATGFVGRYVVRELVARGYEPVCLVRDVDRFRNQFLDEIRMNSKPVAGDMGDRASVVKAAEGCEAAIHLVGIIEEKRLRGQTFRRIHVDGTRNVIYAAWRAGLKRYLHMSALGTRADAVSEYHLTKWQAEELVRKSGLNWTIFRPSIIHGPDGEFMQMMKHFVTDRLRSPVMPYFGRGDRKVQPISVRDAAAIFVKSLAMPETIGRTYELGGPEQLTWKELYDVCARVIAGRPRRMMSVPVPVAKAVARTIMPLTPSFLVPYKFNVGQVQMSQEDSICDIRPIEATFGLKLRDFREELSRYAELI